MTSGEAATGLFTTGKLKGRSLCASSADVVMDGRFLVSVLFCFFVVRGAAASEAGFVYTSSVNSTSARNSAALPNTTVADYNQTGVARLLVEFGSGSLDYTQPYYLAFIAFSTAPSAFFLAILVHGSPTGELPRARTLRAVWIANLHRPVADQATLQLAPDGNLLLWDANGEVAWSTRTVSGTAGALLLSSSGNLQVLGADNSTLWQSFDAPCDALLVGQTLRHAQLLASADVGASLPSASFQLAMEASGLALSPASSQVAYWAWGSFANDTYSLAHTCSHLLAATLQQRSHGVAISLSPASAANSTTVASLNDSALCSEYGTPNTSYYSIPSVADQTSNSSFFLRLETDGNLRGYAYTASSGWQMSWELIDSSTNPCLLPNHCGAYSVCVDPGVCMGCPVDDDTGLSLAAGSSGCSPTYAPTACLSSSNSSQTNSTNSSTWTMLSMVGITYINPEYSSSTADLPSQEACEQACAQNCSCAAAFYYSNTSTCLLVLERIEGSLRHSSDTSVVAFLKFDSRDLQLNSTGSGTSSTAVRPLVIGLVVGVIGSCLLTLVAYKAIMVALRRSRWRENENRILSDEEHFMDNMGGMPMLPTRFCFKDLQEATQGFAEMLGKGGFGVVYKGVLPDGRAIAVKKLEGAASQESHKAFYAEVASLGSIHHWNLVQLYGFCAEGPHRLLVYEYMPNGSLGKWLFSPTDFRLPTLSWQTRIDIALGAAKGLSYLHFECKEKIIHLDIKPQNVLLDANFVAKVADFGLCRTVNRGDRFVVTTMRGTPGYVAPEWLLESAITEKSDVYSFGMVLLELISGRRNHSRAQYMDTSFKKSSSDTEDYYFPALALRMLKEKREVELVDARLGEAFDRDEAKKMVRIALLCVQEESGRRPDMCKVVQMLEKDCFDVPDPPLTQNFHVFLEAAMGILSTKTASSATASSQALLLAADEEEQRNAQQNSYVVEYSQVSGR